LGDYSKLEKRPIYQPHRDFLSHVQTIVEHHLKLEPALYLPVPASPHHSGSYQLKKFSNEAESIVGITRPQYERPFAALGNGSRFLFG
jgi:hypothetical protein